MQHPRALHLDSRLASASAGIARGARVTSCPHAAGLHPSSRRVATKPGSTQMPAEFTPHRQTNACRGIGVQPLSALAVDRDARRSDVPEAPEAHDIALRYFALFNQRDLDGMLRLVSPDCQHQGLAYPEPFSGRQAVRKFYGEFMNSIPPQIKLVIEDATSGDAHAVGLIWHLELDGRELPFGKGLSFFKVNTCGEICFVRESPEHFVKLQGAALPMLNIAAPMFRRLAPFVEPLVGGLANMAGLGGNTTNNGQRLLPAMSSASPFSLGSQLGPAHNYRQPSESALGNGGAEVASTEMLAARQAIADMEAVLWRTRQEKAALENKVRQMSMGYASGDRYYAERESPAQQSSTSTLTAAPSAATETSVRQSNNASEASSQPMSGANIQSQPINFSGIWIKDQQASDYESYDRALAVMKLGGLQRTTALRLIEGVEIQQTRDNMSVHFLTVVPFFKVTETFSFRGLTTMGRRDLRKGKQTASTKLIPEGVRIDMTWPEPHAGGLVDVFTSPEPNVLHIKSTISVGGASESTVQVYRREAKWQPKNKMTPGAFGLKSYPMNPWADHK
ncbi:hypothetical protein WJX72_001403 [[Myrmecia] bisecta]|uniref:SnoaL-like domain-containing protein n=1 Tax=[Myrmecia] bisecta TaxID=41462 RepID=A0AAW1PCF9_9CHLO